MTTRTAAYIDYQQRASEFAVGDLVFTFMSEHSGHYGRVMAVYPAIGMVDVEWPHGSERMPVEDLQQSTKDMVQGPPNVGHDNIPGGRPVGVPSGPIPQKTLRRVAEAYVKKALYWASADRQYRATSEECAANSYLCPKCKGGNLRKAIYKRRGGASDHLYGCPACLFIIKRNDIIGHPDYQKTVSEVVE